jgi:hypothetical protein
VINKLKETVKIKTKQNKFQQLKIRRKQTEHFDVIELQHEIKPCGVTKHAKESQLI